MLSNGATPPAHHHRVKSPATPKFSCCQTAQLHPAAMAMALAWVVQSVSNFLCPPAKRPQYQAAEGCFSREEIDAIRREHCCHVLSKYTATVDDTHFLEWAGLLGAAPAITQGVCDAVRRQAGGDSRDATQITLEAVVISKSLAEKQDRQTAQDWAWDVLDVQHTGSVDRAHLQAVLEGCMQLAMPGTPCSDFCTEAAAIAAGACAVSGGRGSHHITRDGYTKYTKVCPALNTALTSLLSNIGASAHQQPNSAAAAAAAASEPSSAHGSSQQLLGGLGSSEASPAGPNSSSSSSSKAKPNSRSARAAALAEAAGPGPGSAAIAAAAAAARGPGRMLLPQLGWGLVSPAEGLLQPGWVWLLAAGLAPAHRVEWRLLFSSRKHGLSFHTFMGRLGEATPTLLLIRDKGGALFGGIAHSPWKKEGQFYGDHASCVFSLLSEAQLHPASGINANIQWCGIGFSQLPNGIGFGGQVGHFGLWLDQNMDLGMSRPAATFASPSLSSSEVFQVDEVEAWQLMPPVEEGAPAGYKGGVRSVLDKAVEDRKILEFAGVGKNYSAGIKDEPIED